MSYWNYIRQKPQELARERRADALPVLAVGIFLTALTLLLNKYVHAELGGYISLCMAFIGCAANKEVCNGKTERLDDALFCASSLAIEIGMATFTMYIPFVAGIILGILLIVRGVKFVLDNFMSCNPIPYATQRGAMLLIAADLVLLCSCVFRDLH